MWLPGPEEPDLVARVNGVEGARVVRRCADLAELCGAAQGGVGGIAVLALARGVDRARLADLARAGVRTVLVTGPTDLHRAGALGATVVVAEGAGTAVAVAEAVAELVARPYPGPDTHRGENAGIAAEPAPERLGSLVAIWSAPGAPGRSMLAAALAGALVAAGEATILIDADTTAPALGQQLGLLEETSAIAALCRAAGQGTLEAAEISRRAVRLASGAWFVSGLTRPDRWRELPAEHLSVVLEACRIHAAWTVVDLGGALEAPPSRGADRWALNRTVLREADTVLVVAVPDPVGIRRAVQVLGDLRDAETGSLRVVLNQPRPASSAAVDGAAEALARFAGRAPSWSIPFDEAISAGSGVAPRGRGRRSRGLAAIGRVASDLVAARGSSSVPPRRRRLRG